MPTLGAFTVSLEPVGSNEPLEEIGLRNTDSRAVECFVSVPANPSPNDDYGAEDVPYTIRWSIDSSALDDDGVQVQVEIDGCQKGQPRCYERSQRRAEGVDDGLWATADGSRYRPWVFGQIKTAHPHSALADKAILDRVGSVRISFVRASVVPTPHAVPVTPPFNGGAPLPERMLARVSHWTKLGYIQKANPAGEVGLVAEDVGETLAMFTFLYRSPELVEQQAPAGRAHSRGPTALRANSDVRVSFPGAPSTPDERSVNSDHGPTTSPRALSPSPDRRSPTPNQKQGFPFKRKNGRSPPGEALGDLAKPGRVRAVSMKMGKRVSMLGRSRSSFDGASEELATMEDLRKEVLRLRAEVDTLKQRLA